MYIPHRSKCYLTYFFSFFKYSSNVHNSLAGDPTTTELSGISCVTVLFAPIITLLPIVTPGKTTDSAPIKTLLPIFTCPIFVYPKTALYLHHGTIYAPLEP